jgi:glutathione S-transferase
MSEITLYGSPLSLYTGKARSYLIKARLAYREVLPNSQHFEETVLPKMGGRRSIPTIETTTGEIIRDGGAIIDHYESLNGNLFTPSTAKQSVICRLFDMIGMEGLLRPAMHYRWNFDDFNSEFIKFHFETFVPPTLNRQEMALKRMNQMRDAGRGFGAIPETFPLVEKLYCDLLPKLNSHFSAYPYLLGNRPCIGDFGMIAPLYGHLGRDPKPLSLMQSQAICLFRWVERMNRPEADFGEFSDQRDNYLDDDKVPDTLVEILRQVAKDFVPETTAACRQINGWLQKQENLGPNTPTERGAGMCTFIVEGQSITALAQPYRFFLLKRIQDHYLSLTQAEQADVDRLLDACGMTEVMQLRLDREIGRLHNREVWL